jgi:D-alanyl-D-alanine carboxypeptidase/D-alanyl-D-alanine-endopeptidase (penicillin-binding protein 4)
LRRTLPLFALLFAACATARTESLAQRVKAITGRPQFAGAIWGIDVVDDTGRTIYARNEKTLLIPASNRKLFAAATVASCEGLDRQLATELWRDREDLIIRGGGDPSLGGRWAFDRDAVFAPFVGALKQRGIAEVRDVIADVSLFDRVTIPSTWKVGNLGSDYAVPTDALAYNENVAGVVSDHCATPVVVTDPSFVPATANVACGRGEPTVRSDAANAIAIIGPMPEHFQTLAGIADPALYAAQALRDVLQRAGIRVTGTPKVSWERGRLARTSPAAGETPAVPGQERIAIIDSPPLWQLLSVVLKPSQNLYAEMLFKGLSAGAQSASYEVSEDIERRFLTSEAAVPGSDFRFVDGCGLSPDDLVTPRAIVTILRWMNEPSRRAIWWMMLARPGDEGTLRRRLLPFADRMRGKTGSISGVTALSGIIKMPDGAHRYFSIIINHNAGDSSDALKAIDAIVGEIAK